MSFVESAKFVGKLMGKAKVAVQTVHRWATKGCRGVVLETICIGGSRCTSAESLQRFFDAVTVAKGSAGVVLEAGVGGVAMPVREVGDVDAILRRAGIVETGDGGGR